MNKTFKQKLLRLLLLDSCHHIHVEAVYTIDNLGKLLFWLQIY